MRFTEVVTQPFILNAIGYILSHPLTHTPLHARADQDLKHKATQPT